MDISTTPRGPQTPPWPTFSSSSSVNVVVTESKTSSDLPVAAQEEEDENDPDSYLNFEPVSDFEWPPPGGISSSDSSSSEEDYTSSEEEDSENEEDDDSDEDESDHKSSSSSKTKMRMSQKHFVRKKAKNKFECRARGCNYGTDNSRDITRHTRIHTGEKPFKCKHCKNRFGVKTNMQLHVESIHKKKKFPCDVCGNKYTTKASMKAHREAKHEGVYYCCPFKTCKMEYNKQHDARKHMNKQHSDSKYLMPVRLVQYSRCGDALAPEIKLKLSLS